MSEDFPFQLFPPPSFAPEQAGEPSFDPGLQVGWTELSAPSPESLAEPALTHPHPEVDHKRVLAEKAAASSAAKVTFIVKGLKDRSGVYRVPFQQGSNLKHYLSKCSLTMLAMSNRVFDQNNLSAGLIRVRHVPKANDVFLIYNQAMPMLQQRISLDSEAKVQLVETPLKHQLASPPQPEAPQTDELGFESI